MSKNDEDPINDEDPMKKILARRQFIEDDDDSPEVEEDAFPDIPDRTEQLSKQKEERTVQAKVSSPAFDLGKMLRRQMGIPEEVPVREEPKVGKLRPEAIQALANAKARDAQRAAEREEAPGESRVSVTSAELQKGSDMPLPPPMMEPPPAPPLDRRATVAMDEPSIPSVEKRKTTVIEEPSLSSSERRATVAMDEPSIPSVEKRKTTVSEIPAVKSNKDLDIIITDLEKLQQEVSGKIGPKNAKELAGHINRIKEDYNSKSGEEQAQTLQKNLQSLEKWSSEKEKETANKSTWKKIGTVISSCISLVGAKIAGKETENIKNNLAQAMKELKTGGKKEVGEWVSKIKQEATKNQERSR